MSSKYKKGSFIVIPNKEMLKGQSPFLQTIFFWICNYSNENGECYPSIKRISESSGCSERKVTSTIKELDEMGFIKKEYRFMPSGERTTNLYQIMIIEKENEGDAGGGAGGALGVVQEVHLHNKEELNPLLTQSISKDISPGGEPSFGNPEYNKLINLVKERIQQMGVVYDSKDDRRFASHFFSKKYKEEIVNHLTERVGEEMDVYETVVCLFQIMSQKGNFWNGKISSVKSLYQLSAKILNSAQK